MAVGGIIMLLLGWVGSRIALIACRLASSWSFIKPSCSKAIDKATT